MNNARSADAMTFRSRVDAWLAGLMGAAGAGGLAVVACVSANGQASSAESAASALTLLAVYSFVIWIFRTTRYTIAGGALVVRSGPFHWTIPLEGITRVRATSNPLSSPALSLRRLEITYGSGKSIMISPDDRAGFLKALGAKIRPGAIAADLLAG